MTKENLVKMTYEVIPTSGGLAVFQVLAPEDILGLEAGDLAKTTVVLQALLNRLDLDPEEKAALEKTLEVIRYLNEGKVDPVELFLG
ncbi:MULTISPECIES: hypothetical protein [Thermus]|uniref:hypothetical protein n=1 Tax=Thermus brockianus TaxID=56956 RepID=UPI001F2C4EDF|nr:hypothetical protein [Thermus brockianus]